MIRYEVVSGVACITLDRPEKRNALDQETLSSLGAALAQSAQDDEVKAVLIAGEGRDFCAGMDLAMLHETSDADILDHLESAQKLAELYVTIRRHPLPVVAAVRGRALGGGAGLATACDVVLATETAQFGYPEVKIGFLPAIVMTMLRHSTSEKRTFDILITGEPIRAKEALQLGLISRVYPDAEFDDAVDGYLASLTAKPAAAVRLTKRLLHHVDGMTFEASLESGTHLNAIGRMTEEARRGFEQFTKKTQ